MIKKLKAKLLQSYINLEKKNIMTVYEYLYFINLFNFYSNNSKFF